MRTLWRGAVLGLVILLAGCGGTDREEVHGVGEGTDDLKLSPCACVEVPLRSHDADRWRELLG